MFQSRNWDYWVSDNYRLAPICLTVAFQSRNWDYWVSDPRCAVAHPKEFTSSFSPVIGIIELATPQGFKEGKEAHTRFSPVIGIIELATKSWTAWTVCLPSSFSPVIGIIELATRDRPFPIAIRKLKFQSRNWDYWVSDKLRFDQSFSLTSMFQSRNWDYWVSDANGIIRSLMISCEFQSRNWDYWVSDLIALSEAIAF